MGIIGFLFSEMIRLLKAATWGDWMIAFAPSGIVIILILVGKYREWKKRNW